MRAHRQAAALLEEITRGKMTRREIMHWAGALGLSASAVAGLVSRRPLASAQESGAVAKGPQVDKLVFWTRSNPDTPDNTEWDQLQRVAKAYTDQIGTKIDMVTVPDPEFQDQLSLDAPAGEGPDMFGPVAHDWVGAFAAQGLALAVPETTIVDKSDFIPASLDLSRYNGKLYALPLFAESVALIYNKDLAPEPPTTWDELVTTATALTHDDVYGFGFPILEDYYIAGFFMGLGSYIFKHENGTFEADDIGLNNEGGVEAAKFLRDMYNQKKPPLPEVAIDRTNGIAVQQSMMEQGQLAMTIDGPWREVPLTEAKINYGVAKLPTLPNGNPMRPFLGVQAMVASAYSKNQEAALDFLSFITATSNIEELFKAFINLPVRASALETPAVKASVNMPTWAEQALEADPMPNIPEMSTVWTPWSDAMAGIIPQNAADDRVQSLLDGAVEHVKQAITGAAGT
jgi:arabinogalactan oligomer/maltooligosaccharide transport system substrate-binding protein